MGVATAYEVDRQRIRCLNDADSKRGSYVLYWMQNSQRTEQNHALELAIQQANAIGQHLLVVFCLVDDYPEANIRHYTFLLEGLADVAEALEARGIKFVIERGQPTAVIPRLARNASLVVCDRGYVRSVVHWRKQVAASIDAPLIEVEGDVVVPIEQVTTKAEYAARTIRPKIQRILHRYLVDLRATPIKKDSLGISVASIDVSSADKRTKLLHSLGVDPSVPAVSNLYRGGQVQAQKIFRNFLLKRLEGYGAKRNQPQTDAVSYLSMYLHFGQLSPVHAAVTIASSKQGKKEDRDTLLEELVVRRELACNFVAFTPRYDSFSCLPAWAKKTLGKHATDRRSPRYPKKALENATTEDSYWNAAMREMKHTGYMHNYMRMYWGKKILEWSSSPRIAHRAALELNNKYFLDGRDPNSYANVAWIFGLHDRPWQERPVFGTVRYMSADGLRRKCDPDAYVEKVDRLVARLVSSQAKVG